MSTLAETSTSSKADADTGYFSSFVYAELALLISTSSVLGYMSDDGLADIL